MLYHKTGWANLKAYCPSRSCCVPPSPCPFTPTAYLPSGTSPTVGKFSSLNSTTTSSIPRKHNKKRKESKKTHLHLGQESVSAQSWNWGHVEQCGRDETTQQAKPQLNSWDHPEHHCLLCWIFFFFAESAPYSDLFCCRKKWLVTGESRVYN